MWKWLGIILVAGVVGWGAAMLIHAAHAAPHPDGGMTIVPRGPGGPPVVIKEDEEPGPKWKIVVTMEGPPGKEVRVYGDPEKGIRWYANKDECEKARKGDPRLNAGLKLLYAQIKASKMPIEVKVECKPDNSV